MVLRLLVAGLLLASHCAWAEPLRGRVVAVADGDTVTVLDDQRQQHKIRLSGIDAPEKAQDFGNRSKVSLSAMVFNREVEVIGDKLDRYGRRIGKVMVAELTCTAPDCPKSLDTGLQQIATGMAWWYRQYAREQSPKDREDYEVAEFQAKIQRLGLWADKNPVPPWDWRKDRR